MKSMFALAAVAVLGLSACDAPAPGLTIGPDAFARGDSLGVDMVSPRVSSRTTATTFDQYCGRFIGNPAGTRRAVQAAGYFLLGSGTDVGLEMWASDVGRPLVATGRQDGAEVCMVMVAEDRNLGSAVSSYVQQKHGSNATSMGSMQVGPDTAENVFIAPSQPPVIYFTLVQNQPPLGRIQAFAVATGQ